eukprot:scaffold1376_cov257-Pinguiococcus_pyrenoidosus.AAC.10
MQRYTKLVPHHFLQQETRVFKKTKLAPFSLSRVGCPAQSPRARGGTTACSSLSLQRDAASRAAAASVVRSNAVARCGVRGYEGFESKHRTHFELCLVKRKKANADDGSTAPSKSAVKEDRCRCS